MKKKWWSAVLAAVVCLFVFNPLTAWSAEKGPIKIGLLAPLTGGFAAQGKDMLAAFQQYLEEINYQVAGRKIELLVEDDEANPA
ncbi:MAG: ABC transporter substrate-binding protein, partial [Deltaproteobacteria bacterium]|nr:ABC transporter substrate-binding protein [Deltaproteobacteria bacterium]